jgi:hypothetical protein
MCVQRFDDSLNSAIHITYRISLRSSSLPEPRDPLLKVLQVFASATSDGTVPRAGFAGTPAGSPAEAKRVMEDKRTGGGRLEGGQRSVMILPQVHLLWRVSKQFRTIRISIL